MAMCEEIYVTVPADEPDRSAALAELHQALARLPSGSLAEVRVDRNGSRVIIYAWRASTAIVYDEEAVLRTFPIPVPDPQAYR
jgi:hypothetical protein